MIDGPTIVALALAYLLVCWVVFVALPPLRIARQHCPRCGIRFGHAVARARLGYSERLYGPGTTVRGGPRRYRGATVVACENCSAEFVCSCLGGLIETFTRRSHSP